MITSVISNNIALSLGMVGALSIVRFRTPVKNPSELVIYFVLITLGIVVNVDGNLAINFVIFLTFITVVTEFYKFLSTRLNIQELNFNENNNIYLKIETTEYNDDASNSKYLRHLSNDDNYLYIFASTKRESLDSIKNTFDKEKIISSSLDFAD